MQHVAPIAAGLFEITSRVRFAGIEMPARTVVVELGGGGVVVHAPGQLSSEIQSELESLGPVRGLIAPNCFHHLFIDRWLEAYPDAALHVSPGLIGKRPDLESAAPLGDEPPELWRGELQQHRCAGIPKLDEVLFFHPASGTLINTDLMHNMNDEPRWLARTAWRAMGAYGRFGPSRLERWWTRDKPALRGSIERVLDWGFDRVTVAHGDVLEGSARDQVRAGWSWLW
jgi:hypothetical protein